MLAIMEVGKTGKFARCLRVSFLDKRPNACAYPKFSKLFFCFVVQSGVCWWTRSVWSHRTAVPTAVRLFLVTRLRMNLSEHRIPLDSCRSLSVLSLLLCFWQGLRVCRTRRGQVFRAHGLHSKWQPYRSSLSTVCGSWNEELESSFRIHRARRSFLNEWLFIEGGGRVITLSADGQLLNEDLTKCSESHFPRNALWMRNAYSNSRALGVREPSRCKGHLSFQWL